MSDFKAGFGRANINPMLGIDLSGYYEVRKAEGILDDLEINALALECKKNRIIILSVDNCGLRKYVADEIRGFVSAKTGLPYESVLITATHTHTGPGVRPEPQYPLETEYMSFLKQRAADVSQIALNDLKPAKAGFGAGCAPHVAFIRRFRMKDGSIRTNPGVGNPDVLGPVGEVDESVNVIRFDRDGAETIVLVNFANHPDTVGGNKISGDWPHFLRMTVEKALDNTKCIFINGAEGDVNHVNVNPTGGDMNGMFMDFDSVARGYSHARHIGNVVAGGVLQVFEKVKYIDVKSIGAVEIPVKIASNRGTPDRLAEAKRIHKLHAEGRDNELPYEGMMLTTVIAEAERIAALENGPDYFEMTLCGINIGSIALIGFPGEPFTGVGRALKQEKPFDMVMTACMTNGREGYFPMQEAYDEGGYESKSSRFKAGVAEYLIKESKKILKELSVSI